MDFHVFSLKHEDFSLINVDKHNFKFKDIFLPQKAVGLFEFKMILDWMIVKKLYFLIENTLDFLLNLRITQIPQNSALSWVSNFF